METFHRVCGHPAVEGDIVLRTTSHLYKEVPQTISLSLASEGMLGLVGGPIFIGLYGEY